MHYRKMPKTGDRLSALGFGCMRLPMTDGVIDEERATAQLRSAIDSGVNYVDTAWPYHGGESEPFVGRALTGGYREKIRLATKLPSWMVATRADMDRYLDAQLTRLQTSRIDYYLVHTLDGPLWDRLSALDVAGFLDAAKADGRIGQAGFSFHGLAPDFLRIVDAYDWTFCQIQYNYLDQDFQAGTSGLKHAASRGLGVVVMEPLRGGLLARPAPPPAVAEIWDRAATKRSPAQWALRWVWDHPEVTVVLSGMNEEAHIAENLAVAEEALPGSLKADELALVDDAAAAYKRLMQVGCTGCGYCMPCPAGVQIPKCFDWFNSMYLTGNREEARLYYILTVGAGLISETAGLASQCVECGQCMENCPQHIAIPEVLKRVVVEMEGDDLEEKAAALRQAFRAESR